ncbi:Uncharacterised protein [Mycobacteroides abscessus subsp. abscessus]|nr:Uncharacterised protein [Mycobacteroides abscessus subsp. abscessus]
MSCPLRQTDSSAIFRLTSRSEVATPAALSMKSALTLPPRRAKSTRARWVRPRLPPSPMTRARNCSALTRTLSLAGSAAST